MNCFVRREEKRREEKRRVNASRWGAPEIVITRSGWDSPKRDKVKKRTKRRLEDSRNETKDRRLEERNEESKNRFRFDRGLPYSRIA